MNRHTRRLRHAIARAERRRPQTRDLPFADRARQRPVFQIAATLALIIAAASFVVQAQSERRAAEEQRRQAEYDRKSMHFQAWQVINTAYDKPGSGGRIAALEELNREGESLAGVDLSGAWLIGINLTRADMWNCNLRGACLASARLDSADLTSAHLERAILAHAHLNGARLWMAQLDSADLFASHLGRADLACADLQGIRQWREIKDLTGANLHDVRNEPEGFSSWALSMGAVDRSPISFARLAISDWEQHEKYKALEDSVLKKWDYWEELGFVLWN